MSVPDCTYCLGTRGDTALTQEHVWPAALGGRLAPPTFQTPRVCKTCNNLAGQFVDAAYLKSWFVKNEAISAQQLFDPDQPRASSLMYMGFENSFPTAEGEVCERWIGPAGDHVYHIHTKDDARWETVAGGDFIKRRKSDGGRAYIVLTSNVEYWAVTSLLSFAAWFPFATRRCITQIGGTVPDFGVMWRDQEPVSEREATEIAYIRGRPDGEQVLANIPVQVDFADRFLAKLSLGLADSILGPAAVRSPYADHLRTALWTRDPEVRAALPIKGVGFWAGDQQLSAVAQALHAPGAWTILLWAQREALTCVIVSPGGRPMMTVVSDDSSLWPEHIGSTYGQGVVHIAIPERQEWLGPIPLANVIATKLGNMRDATLARLDAMREEGKRVPAKLG